MTLVSCSDLSAGYGNGAVISELAFSVEPGARVAVLGPNGGGKTTLFRVLTGELGPLGGKLEIDRRPCLGAADRSLAP